MFKKSMKKAVCAILAVTGVCASLATFTACETNHPTVEMKIEFNDETYTLEYKLYRQLAPSTVNHFLKLAENGYYDGLCVHDYDMSASRLYTGGYSYDESADNGGLVYKDYYNVVKGYAIDDPASFWKVWTDSTKTTPTYTLYGEFEANNFVVESGALAPSFGSLTMYYTTKDTDARVSVVKSDGEIGSRAYANNSATSLFYIALSDSTSANTNYCTFATLEDDSVETLEDLQEAIETYIEDNYGDDEGDEEDFVTETYLYVDEDDAYVGDRNSRVSYDVPNEPIVIKSVKVKKY